VGLRGCGVCAASLLLAAAIASLLAPVAVAAGMVTVWNPYPFTVILVTPDGLVALEPGGRAEVSQGRICVASPEVYYEGEGVRYRLSGAIVDGRLADGVCGDAASSFQPFYTVEYRVLLVSDPPGVAYQELWGPAGGRVTVEAPPSVEEEYARYTIKSLVLPGGVEVPGYRAELALHAPATVKALYAAEYRVVVEGAGREYWYSGGPLMIPVEEVIVAGEGYRLVPVKLVAGGLVLQPQGGYFVVPEGFKGVLKPVFKKEYLLHVKGPQGERMEWHEEGATVTLEFPNIIDVSPEERLVYRGALIDGSRAPSPTIELVMDSPHTVEAVYDRQYRVRIVSLLGTLEDWATEGALYTLNLPQTIPGGIFTNLQIAAVIVNGEALPGVEGLRIPVYGPLNVTVIYAPQPITWRILLASIPLTLISTAAAIYIYRWLQGEERA